MKPQSTPLLLCSIFFVILLCSSSAFASQTLLDSLQTQLASSKIKEQPVASTLYAIGKIFKKQSKSEAAISYLSLAFEAAEKEQNNTILFASLEKLAYINNSRGESEKALQHFLHGLNLADSLDLKREKADYLFYLGDYFRLQKHIDAAIEKLNQAEIIYQELGLQKEICGRVWFTKAATYKVSDNKEDQNKTVSIYKNMLSGDCVGLFDSLKIGKIYNNLGSTLIFQGKFEEAENYLLMAMKIKRKYGGLNTQAHTLNELSSLAFAKKQFRPALKFALEAEQLASQVDNIHLTYDILENIGLCYQNLGNYAESINYLKKHFDLRDSLNNKSRVFALAELELKYEAAKNERVLAMQKLQINQQKSKNRNLLWLGALLSVIAISIFIWYQSRLKRKEAETSNLERLNSLKTRYFTNISHELRTPLSLIIDPIKRLQASIKDDKQLGLINTVAANSNSMLQLVNQMLDLSKLEAGKLKLKARQSNLVSTVAATVSSFTERAQSANIQLIFTSDEASIEAIHDNDMLVKILNNLLSNAVKFTPDGGAISVILLRRGETAEIIVNDTGVGIPADKLPHIFERFFQIDDSHTRRFAGTGIGLSLVKELVELHNGTIDVKSEISKGTAVTINIPLGAIEKQISTPPIEMINTPAPLQKIGEQPATPIIQAAPVKEISNAKKATARPLEKPLVLLIEDNWDLRTYLVKQLEEHFEFTQADNGVDGVRIAQEQIPDLIISDIMMPGIDGYEVCKKLKSDKRSAHIPLILLTAKSSQAEKIAGLKLGVDDYLTKPFDSEEILLRMENLIAQRKKWLAQFGKGQMITPKMVTTNSVDEKFLSNLLEQLESNLSNDKFGVEELSKTVGLSRSQLHRKIKGLTGKSTNLFIRGIRLQRARQLLEQQAGSASEIAFTVGFNNANYFFKCFKEEFGITAGQVLKGESVIGESK